MRTGSISFAQSKKNHSDGIKPKSGQEEKDEKRQDVRNKGKNHGTASAKAIGKNSGGNFQDQNGNFPQRNQGADLQKTESLLTKKENDEGIEKP